MNLRIAILLVLFSLTCSNAAHAQEITRGSVTRIATRDVSVPVYAVWRENALATLVLYSGGSGGYGRIGENGWPASGNFLIRSAQLFAAHPFNVIMVGKPTDLDDLDGIVRTGDKHNQDNQAIFRHIRSVNSAPIWLIGTSMGTISATAAAIADGGHNVAGVVLTSSVTRFRIQGAVRMQALDKINVPVLVVHHRHDACKACTPYEAEGIAGDLRNAPVKKTVLVDGGSNPTGDPCGAMHYHGYIGMEKEVVDLITAWILNPAN